MISDDPRGVATVTKRGADRVRASLVFAAEMVESRPQWLIRAEAGWPGTLKRLPVSFTLVPLTLRIEKSWSR